MKEVQGRGDQSTKWFPSMEEVNTQRFFSHEEMTKEDLT